MILIQFNLISIEKIVNILLFFSFSFMWKRPSNARLHFTSSNHFNQLFSSNKIRNKFAHQPAHENRSFFTHPSILRNIYHVSSRPPDILYPSIPFQSSESSVYPSSSPAPHSIHNHQYTFFSFLSFHGMNSFNFPLSNTWLFFLIFPTTFILFPIKFIKRNGWFISISLLYSAYFVICI